MKFKLRPSGVSIAINKTLRQQNDSSSDQGLSQYTIEVANSLEKREAVYKMVYKAYRDKNFIPENQKGTHIIQQDASPDTLILFARDQFGEIAGTVTLVFDQSVSLPATKIYAKEIKKLRDKGEVIAEVSRLAISKKHRFSKEILALLFNHLAVYCQHIKKVSSLICEVNPRHVLYYQSILNFEQIGDVKPCPLVQENPAVLLKLSIHNFETLVNSHQKTSKFKALYSIDEFKTIANNLRHHRKAITAREVQYFNLPRQSSYGLFVKFKNRLLTFH